MNEIYKHFSHFNFAAEQSREAALRYLELEREVERLEKEDAEVDHDELAYNFTRCDICEDISELQNCRDEFAKEFAAIWAKQAVGDGGGKVE